MATLASGLSTTITLAAGQELYFPTGGAGVAVIGSGQRAGTSYQIGNSRQTIGPFDQSVAVSISASALLAYFVITDPALTEPPAVPVTGTPAEAAAFPALVSGAGMVSGLAALSASATANAAIIQAALNLGGLVQIPPGLGDVFINSTLTIKSNTRLVIGDGSALRIATGLGARVTLLRNANWGSTQYSVAAGTMTTADGKVGTCRFTAATDFSVGQYVCFQYAAPDEWNGIWRVLSVSTTTLANDTITFRLTSTQTAATPAWTSPATALTNVPGSAILGCQADVNIQVEGGAWNHGGFDQGSYSVAVNLTDVMVYFRRVKALRLHRTISRGAHYSFMVANCYGVNISDLYAEDCGNGLMLSGGGRDIRVRDIRGITFDNIWAIQQGDYTGYVDAGYTMADFADVLIERPHSDGAYIQGKMIGAAANINVRFRDITIAGMSGWVSGPTVFNMNDDPGMVPFSGAAAAPGTRCGTVVIKDTQLSRALTGLIVSITENASVSTIENLTVTGSRVRFVGSGGNASALVYLTRTSAATNITNLVVQGNDISADTTTNTFAVVLGGNVPGFRFTDNICKTLATCVSQTTSATSPITDGEISNIQASGCGAIWKNGTASNVMRFRNWTHVSPGAQAVQAFGGSMTANVSHMYGMPNSIFWLDSAWSSASVIWTDFYRNALTASTGTTAINYAAGSLQDITLSATTTISNPTRPPTGAGSRLTVKLTSTGAFTPTFDTLYKNAPALGASSSGQTAIAEFVYSGSDWRYAGGSGWVA